MDKIKYIALAFVALLFGIAIAPKDRVEAPAQQCAVCEVCKTETYEKLIDTDAEMIQTLSNALVLAGEGFQAVSRGDVEYINNMTTQVESMSTKVELLRVERQQLLNDLK
jgi:hypothetical protein